MYKYHRVLIAIGVLLAMLVVGLIYNFVVARSQGAMPGSQPLEDEASAIAVAQTVATFNLTNSADTSQITFDTIKRISSTEFQELLKSNEINVDPSILVNMSSGGNSKDEATEQYIWIVTFRGSFSPKRGPGIVLPSAYSIIDIILDARDGSVIGIQMHD